MPLYHYKLMKPDGTVEAREEFRVPAERANPLVVDGVTYPVCADLSPGTAVRGVESCHTYMPADGFTRGMPKRPGMSGVNYGNRTWPAERGNTPVIPIDA